MIHCSQYLITICVVSLPVVSFEVLKMNVVLSLLHMMIELGKYWYIKKLPDAQRKCNDRNIYIVEQILYLLCIIGISFYMTVKGYPLCEWWLPNLIMEVTGLSEMMVVSWMTTILLLHKPTNSLIQSLLKSYKPQGENVIKRDNNAGRFIGTLERVVMLIFISLGQYSAAGLVLTAKSIARYDRISKDKEFAEYYLLGTLLSTLIVVACFLVIQFLGSYY